VTDHISDAYSPAHAAPADGPSPIVCDPITDGQTLCHFRPTAAPDNPPGCAYFAAYAVHRGDDPDTVWNACGQHLPHAVRQAQPGPRREEPFRAAPPTTDDAPAYPLGRLAPRAWADERHVVIGEVKHHLVTGLATLTIGYLGRREDDTPVWMPAGEHITLKPAEAQQLAADLTGHRNQPADQTAAAAAAAGTGAGADTKGG
jgi:hypothetical protein